MKRIILPLGALLAILLAPIAPSMATQADLYCYVGAGHAAFSPCSAIPKHIISAASDNAQSIIAGSHAVTSVTAVNTTTTMYYLKFYDTASTPSCGTTPVALTYPIPFGASNSGGGIVVPLPPGGLLFTAGIGVCIVAGINDNDDTSAATGIAVDIGYQ